MAPPDESGTPAGYGRSCTNCSRAKCKCILRPDNVVCERCHRLGKECIAMTSSRKKSSKKVTASRTAQLEEKLDDLVSILRATQGGPSHPQAAQALQSVQAQLTQAQNATSRQPEEQHPVQPTQPTSIRYPTPDRHSSRLDSLATAATSTNAQTTSQTFASSCILDSAPQNQELSYGASNLRPTDHNPEPTPEEAEEYLAKFRNWLQYFPFFNLPADLTAKKLRQTKPFLWLCIMSISSLSMPQIALMRDTVRKELGRKIMVENERSLDILQGLITTLMWATVNAGPTHKPTLVLYSQLGNAVFFDLALSRSPLEEHYFTLNFKLWGVRPPPAKIRTMEERRVILALWYSNSISCSFIGKMDVLRWNPHMEDCLTTLEQTPEFASDDVLATLVRTQQVAEEAQKLLVRDVLGEQGQTPTFVYKQSLMNRLQDIRNGMAPSTATSRKRSSHTLVPVLALLLSGADLVRSQNAAAEFSIHSVGAFVSSVPDHQRVEAMYHALKAVKVFFDVFFSIPASEMVAVPFALYIHLSQAQLCLYRLSVSDDPAWDKEYVRNTVDLLVNLDQTIDKLLSAESAHKFRAGSDEETLFRKGARMMRTLRSNWEPSLSQHGGLPTPNSQLMAQHTLSAAHPIVDSHMNAVMPDPAASFEFGELGWMSDVFGPWDF